MNQRGNGVLLRLIPVLRITGFRSHRSRRKHPTRPHPAAAEEAVRDLVEQFGKKLQIVSLLAPKDTLRESMREHYADHVSPALFEAWQNDPASVPGRLASSPWPDRIEVRPVEKRADDAYRVEGGIIETASVDEDEDGEPAMKRPVTLEVRNMDGRWLIDAVELEEYEDGDQAESAEGPSR